MRREREKEMHEEWMKSGEDPMYLFNVSTNDCIFTALIAYIHVMHSPPIVAPNRCRRWTTRRGPVQRRFFNIHSSLVLRGSRVVQWAHPQDPQDPQDPQGLLVPAMAPPQHPTPQERRGEGGVVVWGQGMTRRLVEAWRQWRVMHHLQNR